MSTKEKVENGECRQKIMSTGENVEKLRASTNAEVDKMLT